MKKRISFVLILIVLLSTSACTAASPQATPIVTTSNQSDPTNTTVPATASNVPANESTATLPAQATLTAEPAPTQPPLPTATLGVDDWQSWPVYPETLSQRARDIYIAGLEAGNDPGRFSKIGDCQNINTFFLALYDSPESYTLGDDYQALQSTIDYYGGSWSRDSISVRGGFNVATIFNPWFSDKEVCGENETPIDCELRINKPSVVLISMEAWWKGDPARYEMHLRRIVDTVLTYNALPILATKADNLEGDHDINRAIVQIAYEYELPLWNFWRAVQDIPRKGLEDDMFHLTHGINDFSDPKNLRQGWPVRNLTALQTLDAVRGLLSSP